MSQVSQQSGTYNFIIQDNNGNPQYIKVQSRQQPKTAVKPEQAKIVPQKTNAGGGPWQNRQEVSSGSVTQTGQQQLIRTLTIHGKSRQFVTIPVQSPLHLKTKGETSKSTTPQILVQATKRPAYSNSNTQNRDVNGLSRKVPDVDIDDSPVMNKRRKTEKGGKGLRHFSMKVCEKVRKKGLTTYNEVADELVAEFTDPKHVPNSVDQQYDQKNIRRRVYDALNVLMAMNIISKEKKEIKWLGLPTNSAQESISLRKEKREIAERIMRKKKVLANLLIQQIIYNSLTQRNFEAEKLKGPPATNTSIPLPFIVVNSDKKTVIDCSISADKTEYLFLFNDKFEMKDDYEVLKDMGLTYGLLDGTITKDNLNKIKNYVPKTLGPFIEQIARDNKYINTDNDLEDSLTSALLSVQTELGAGPSSSDGFNSPNMVENDGTSDEESNISDPDTEY